MGQSTRRHMMTMYLLFLLPAVAFAASIDSHIVGGSNANIANYKYQGSYRTSFGSHSCGLVLIANSWGLCAAHCGGSSAYTTEWGSSNRGSGRVVGVSRVTLHPNYGSGSGAFPNDISVVQLSSSAAGTNAEPIAMASSRISIGSGVISGWGRTCGGCSLPITLQAVTIPVITDATCSGRWGSNYNSAIHVCVWDSVNQDRGACNGDSGGPMVANNALQGVTSWGASGCTTSMPSVYTRVSNFRSWACTNTNNQALGC